MKYFKYQDYQRALRRTGEEDDGKGNEESGQEESLLGTFQSRPLGFK